MNKRITNIIRVFILLFIALLVNLTYWQIFAANSLINNEYNTRALNQELSLKRGEILTADKVVVARSEKQGRFYKRIYPFREDYAPIIGYYDARLGRSGLEQTQNDYLLGRDKLDTISDYVDRIAGRDKPGDDVILTIDSVIQAAAAKSMQGKKGAVVVLDPGNGEILAMVSTPSYNPNDLADNWNSLTSMTDSPLVNRATTGLYPPGSSFKIISASAIVDSGKAGLTSTYDAPASLPVYGGKVTNYGGKSFGSLTLEKAFAYSVNTVFAKVGLDLGPDKLVDYCKGFGFGDKPPIEIPSKASIVKSPSAMDDLEVAWTAVGQAGLLASPLQMALAACAVANKGVINKPHLIKKVRDHSGLIVEQPSAGEWKKPISAQTASSLRHMMRVAVNQGTGTGADISGAKILGKTGTAEIKGKSPHAWFIGIAPGNKPKYVITVLIENGGTGGSVAAPVAKEILQVALARHRGN